MTPGAVMRQMESEKQENNCRPASSDSEPRQLKPEKQEILCRSGDVYLPPKGIHSKAPGQPSNRPRGFLIFLLRNSTVLLLHCYFTVTLIFTFFFPEVIVMVALPFFSALIFPPDTFATFLLELL